MRQDLASPHQDLASPHQDLGVPHRALSAAWSEEKYLQNPVNIAPKSAGIVVQIKNTSTVGEDLFFWSSPNFWRKNTLVFCEDFFRFWSLFNIVDGFT